MSFWSGEKLLKRLREENLVSPLEEKNIDCAAYTLTVGNELYITPSKDSKPKHRTKRMLKDRESFYIPSGQFAFLMTAEVVKVPTNALAFISFKARIKFKGLVNVSGFHVDPGYNDRLYFSIYNAGPGPIHLTQGQHLFLIWYADLDTDSTKVKTSANPKLDLTELINGLSGELHTPASLDERIKNVEKEQLFTKPLVPVLITLVVGLGFFGINQCTQIGSKTDDINERLHKLEAIEAVKGRPSDGAAPIQPSGSGAPVTDAGSVAGP